MRLRAQGSAVLAALLGVLVCSQRGYGSILTCGSSPEERAALYSKALDALRGEYDIIEGSISFPNFAQPDGHYGIVNFPSDVTNPPVLCAIGRRVHTPYGPGLCNFTVVMGPRDGVAAMLCTPPPTRYFSFRSYTGFRFRPRPWLPAAELADPANHLVLNTTAAPGEDPFGKTMLVVSTGDGHTARRTLDAFVDAGFPENATNLDIMSADRAYFRDFTRPWLLDRSDAFVWYLRVSSIIDKEAVAEYMKVKWPVYLLRAKDNISPSEEPLYQPPDRPRGTGETEDHLVKPLRQLEEAVIADMKTRGAVLHSRIAMEHTVPDYDRCFTDPTYSPIAGNVSAWNMTGFATCGFFTRDAVYTFISSKVDFADLVFPKNRTYFLLGVNQVAVKKAVYSNIFMTAVNAPQQIGRTVNYSALAVAGSADYYVPNLEEKELLFAMEISRDCGDRDGRFCTSVTEHTFNYTEPIFVVERKYLENATKTGPDPREVLPPVVLSFEYTPSSSWSRSRGMDEEELTATK